MVNCPCQGCDSDGTRLSSPSLEKTPWTLQSFCIDLGCFVRSKVTLHEEDAGSLPSWLPFSLCLSLGTCAF